MLFLTLLNTCLERLYKLMTWIDSSGEWSRVPDSPDRRCKSGLFYIFFFFFFFCQILSSTNKKKPPPWERSGPLLDVINSFRATWLKPVSMSSRSVTTTRLKSIHGSFLGILSATNVKPWSAKVIYFHCFSVWRLNYWFSSSILLFSPIL